MGLMHAGRLLLATTLVLASCTQDRATPPSADQGLHVVVDTDLGPDDIMALLYLLRRDDVVVDAVTIDGDGIVRCDAGVPNALRLLALAGVPETPVACGGAPLAGDRAFPEAWRDYAGDLSALGLPPPGGETVDVDAPDLLRRSLTGEVSLLTLGPLTNVAEALRRDPSLSERIPSMVSMAGAVGVPGNAPAGLAEYNVWIDPLAAREAFSALPTTLVPLDATNTVPATVYFVDVLETLRSATPEADAVYRLLRGNEQIAQGTYYFWDPLAAVLSVRPELGRFEDQRVMLDSSDTLTGGWMSEWDRGIPMTVATTAVGLDVEREYLSTLSGVPVTAVRPDPDLVVKFDDRACSVNGSQGVAAGDLDVALDNRGSAAAFAAVAGLEGITYDELVHVLGGAGATVRKEPAGVTILGSVAAEAGGTSMGRISVGSGAAAIVCAIPHGRAFVVYPGAALRVHP